MDFDASRGVCLLLFQESMAIVFLVSKLSCESKYCKEEVFFARSCGVPIVPVVLEWPGDALKSGLKLILGQIQWIFLPEVSDAEPADEESGSTGKHLLRPEDLPPGPSKSGIDSCVCSSLEHTTFNSLAVAAGQLPLSLCNSLAIDQPR